MKTFRTAMLALAVATIWTVAPQGLAERISDYNRPISAMSPELDKALGDDRLLAAAEKTRDGKTLLGLARFASPEARAKIVEIVMMVSPPDAPAAAAFMCAFSPETRLRIEDVDRFSKVDPDNGVALCLRANLLLRDGKTAEAVAELKRGSAALKFDTYDNMGYRKGVIAALDLLGLTGKARLLALQRAMNDRVNPPSQGIYWSFMDTATGLVAVARDSSPERQIEMSDMLMKLGGRLIRENGSRREGAYCGFAVLARASKIRGLAATDKDVSVAWEYMQFISGCGPVAQDLPQGDILEALTIAGSDLSRLQPFDSPYYSDLAAADKAKVDEALAKVRAAGQALIGLMAADPDEIAGVAVVSDLRSASEAMLAHPDVREAMLDVLDRGEAAVGLFTSLSAPQRSQSNLKRIGLSLLMYSSDHGGKFPPDLKTLLAEGYLMKGTTIESPVTGRPYVYLGAGLLDSDHPNRLIAYDGTIVKGGTGGMHVGLYVDGHTMLTPPAAIEDAVKADPE